MMEKKNLEKVGPWIENFCNRKENNFFCFIEKDFIEDEFNLIGLNFQFSDLDMSLGVILNNSYSKKKNKVAIKNETLELLYGLLHSRYIFTTLGIHKIFKKFSDGLFGICSGFYCVNSRLLPFGSSDTPNRSILKFFCPKCKNLFRNSFQNDKKVDSSFFGSSFLFFFLSAYPECVGIETFFNFIPRNFGFRFSEFYSRGKKNPNKNFFLPFFEKFNLRKPKVRICCGDIFWVRRNSFPLSSPLGFFFKKDRYFNNKSNALF
mmetsp:Transcript_53595/g.107404  ORF Transcript_53595/g.107404 Transcript_53595/m.107404 type:complete len:262 (-) Transcript_53595:1825-2610(-)